MHDLLVSDPRPESQGRSSPRQRAPFEASRDEGFEVKTTIPYRVGDTIIQRTFIGIIRTVKVASRDPDIKNGRSGFDGTVAEGPAAGASVWGYDSQVVRVVR